MKRAAMLVCLLSVVACGKGPVDRSEPVAGGTASSRYTPDGIASTFTLPHAAEPAATLRWDTQAGTAQLVIEDDVVRATVTDEVTMPLLPSLHSANVAIGQLWAEHQACPGGDAPAPGDLGPVACL